MRSDAGLASHGIAAVFDAAADPQMNVVWLDGSDTPREPRLLHANWLRCLEHDPVASIYLHPRLVLASAEPADAPPAIYARKSQADPQSSGLEALAVLGPKLFRSHPMPGCRWGVPLKGYWLVGNQLLGSNSQDAVAEFTESAIRLLESGRAQCVYFDDLEVGCDLWNAIEQASRTRRVVVSHPQTPQPHWWLQFPDRAADYWQQMPSKTRRNFHGAARKFEHTLQCFTDQSQVPDMLEQAQRISRQTWQSQRLGRCISNSDRQQRFWQAIASLGALRSYVLNHNGQPAAFMLAWQWKGRLMFEEMGYDRQFRTQSPGSVLFLRMFEDLIARNTPQRVDYGFGHADYKRWLCNRQTLTGPVMMVRRSFWPATVMRLDHRRRWASERFRIWLREWPIAGALRRLYRR